MNIKQYLDVKRKQVDAALENYLLEEKGTLAGHIKAMRYSLFAGGKRVRPILCIAAAESLKDFNDDFPESLMLAACALECIHTYSLIHDDLPAMDDDELRRGKPTNHMVFGEAYAILAGDSLLTYAFDLLTRDAEEKTSADERLTIISLISKAVGPEGMVGGQFLDLQHEGKEIHYDMLREIHSRKTGALITASVQTGAILGGSRPEQFRALSKYGNKIGLAFQIVDDLLNVEGTEEQLGKAAGSDAERNKATYPAMFGVDETKKKASEAVDESLAALETFDERANMLRELAKYILTRKR
ncbi:MAG: polyprenyl synthetase family protein [Deltaproteobacteria bacterium]|jgi:geranylgeranyl diphosphate synthase type II|nr:MAG: polyprenyl synthetase family protein [Deltaproteobacteria bacterium]